MIDPSTVIVLSQSAWLHVGVSTSKSPETSTPCGCPRWSSVAGERRGPTAGSGRLSANGKFKIDFVERENLLPDQLSTAANQLYEMMAIYWSSDFLSKGLLASCTHFIIILSNIIFIRWTISYFMLARWTIEKMNFWRIQKKGCTEINIEAKHLNLGFHLK